MLEDFSLLSIIIFLPLLGALFILLIRGDEEHIDHNVRIVALWTSLLTFILSLVLIFNFEIDGAAYQFVENTSWISELKIRYHVGVDGISVLFILLTTFLTPLCILASWTSINNRVRGYMLAFLLLECLMIGMFSARDLVLFYIFFEGVLIPMFLIIGIWGGEFRLYACFKFFLYTLFGSIFMLLAIIVIYLQVGTTDMDVVSGYIFNYTSQKWLWIALFASFAVKTPMWPVHTWLPDAHGKKKKKKKKKN